LISNTRENFFHISDFIFAAVFKAYFPVFLAEKNKYEK